MRHKGLKQRQIPLDLGVMFAAFGEARRTHPTECTEIAKMGQLLIREVQHLHGLLVDVRQVLPETYDGYVDPARLDVVLARTNVSWPTTSESQNVNSPSDVSGKE